MAAANSIAPSLTAKQIDRFWAKVAKTGPDDCWLWTAATAPNGYGVVRIKFGKWLYKNCPAHSLARYLSTGVWPAGLDTCHSCDHPPCCNPSHLWLGTPTDNAADMIGKGRHHNGPRPRGVEQWRAAFTEADIIAIRRDYAAGGVTLQQIADNKHVTKHCIHCIVRRKTWAHVTP